MATYTNPPHGPMQQLVSWEQSKTRFAVYIMSDGRIAPFFRCCNQEQMLVDSPEGVSVCTLCGATKKHHSLGYVFIPTRGMYASPYPEHISKVISIWTGIPQELLEVTVDKT